MVSASSGYQPLATGDKRTWVADDHLLHIKTGLFRERYSRMYWADIRAAIFYRIEQPGTPILIAEGVSVTLVMAGAVLVSPLWGAVTGALFLAVYSAWRFTRPRWAVQLFTKISTVRFPVASSRRSSQLLMDKMRVRILAAQNSAVQPPLANAIGQAVLSVPRTDNEEEPRTKQPRLVFYWLLFAFGSISGLTKATVALYCLLFLMLFFVPREFDFPLSIRSAIVLNQMSALVLIVAWLASFRYAFLFAFGWEMQFSYELKLACVIFSSFGLFAVSARSRKPQRGFAESSSMLGLGSRSE